MHDPDEKSRRDKEVKLSEDNNKLLKNQTKIINKQTKVLESTNKLYALIVFLTGMNVVFFAIQTALDNLSWVENPDWKMAFFILNIAAIPIMVGALYFVVND